MMQQIQKTLTAIFGRVDRRVVQIFFLILTLSLLVIGGAAPEMGGGPGGPGPLSLIGNLF